MAGRKPTVSDEEILRVFAESADPVLSAKEASDHLPIGKQGTYQRLRELDEAGLLASKKIGPSRAWWLTEKGKLHLNSNSS
jgi:repressor of nif and glnA expression